MVPRIAGLLRTKPMPSNSSEKVGGSVGLTDRSSRIAPAAHPASSQNSAMMI